ncbi:unnamed protein product [Prunus armeniaca]|uniref:Uncharacterized protein n=1 Tax=Prunus armeniaca TaxID=36596 RepID=A0A6J5XMR1_PRUAR|nr:unnamed protein product [Prunus armeniaca]CAB4313295.1 unnamed protein product [Prunus armeniaca]
MCVSITRTPCLQPALMIALHMFFMAWFIQILTRTLLLFHWKYSEVIQAQMGEVRPIAFFSLYSVGWFNKMNKFAHHPFPRQIRETCYHGLFLMVIPPNRGGNSNWKRSGSSSTGKEEEAAKKMLLVHVQPWLFSAGADSVVRLFAIKRKRKETACTGSYCKLWISLVGSEFSVL